jgi:hypothetical protein
MDMLASASATMTPLAAEPTAMLGSGGSCARCSSLDNLDPPTSRPLHASSCTAYPSAPLDLQSRIPATAVRDPTFTDSESTLLPRTSATRVSSPPSSPEGSEPRKPLNHLWPIHPENLWKYIPSSPVQQEQPVPSSSPDVSPGVGVGGGSAGALLLRQPRTLEWACAQSAKRRRANPEVHSEDGETDAGCNPEERTAICHSPCVSDVRVPPECFGKYPLDVVRGAVLLLGLKDAAHSLGV